MRDLNTKNVLLLCILIVTASAFFIQSFRIRELRKRVDTLDKWIMEYKGYWYTCDDVDKAFKMVAEDIDYINTRIDSLECFNKDSMELYIVRVK